MSRMEQRRQTGGDIITSMWLVCLGASMASMFLVSLRYTTQAVPLEVPLSRLSPYLFWAVTCYLSVPVTVFFVFACSPTSNARGDWVYGTVATSVFALTAVSVYELLSIVIPVFSSLSGLLHPFHGDVHTSSAAQLDTLVFSALPRLLLIALSLLLLSYCAGTTAHRGRKAMYGWPSLVRTPLALAFTTVSCFYLAVGLLQRLQGVNLCLLSLLPLATAFTLGWTGLYQYLKAGESRRFWLIATGAACLAVAVVTGPAG